MELNKKIKLANIKRKFLSIESSGVLEEICDIFNETMNWHSWEQNKDANWTLSDYLRDYAFIPSYEKGAKKSFESFSEHMNKTYEQTGKLISFIGLKENNIELLLYETGIDRDGVCKFGIFEVLKDGKVVLECSCSHDLPVFLDAWRPLTLNYVSDTSWKSSIKSFRNHLEHDKELKQIEAKTNAEDYLIKKHKD
jgi:hypothetical protein